MAVGVAATMLVAYAGVVAWLTWPLAAHLATHLPHAMYASQFDLLWTTWALAHASRTLLLDPANLLNGNIFHPEPHTLFYGPTAFGALPTFAPVFLATGNPTLAIDVTFLGSTALTAWTLHLVAWRWTGSHLAGVVAAATFLTNRYVLWDLAATAPQYAALQWFPLIVLLAATALDRPMVRVALAALVVVQSLADPVYVAPGVLVPLAVLAASRLARTETRQSGFRLAAVLGVAVLALLPVYAGYLDLYVRNPALASQSVWKQPTVRVPSGALPFMGGPTTVSSIALLVIAAGLYARRGDASSGRPWRHAIFWAAMGCLLSLPPRAGSVLLPHAFLAERVPVYQFLRVPERLAIAGLIGVALLAGLGFAACARRCTRATPSGATLRAAAAALLVALMYAGYASGWDSLHPRKPLRAEYPIVPAIRGDEPLLPEIAKSREPLLELPVRRIDQHARAMYRSIFHWRPLLNGYSSYEPVGFRDRMALAERLPDRHALRRLREETGLRSILVHAHPANPASAPWIALAKRGRRSDLRLLARNGIDLLFAVGP